MSKRGALLSGEAENSDINISPMIDMVFILLIFFIVTAVFVEEPGVEVDRVPAVTIDQLERFSILIAITDGGEVVYGGETIGVGGVRATVRRLININEDMPVILQVDERAPSGIVLRVIDEAIFGGARVYVGTENS